MDSKKNQNKLVVLIIVLIILAGWFYFGSKTQTPVETPTDTNTASQTNTGTPAPVTEGVVYTDQGFLPTIVTIKVGQTVQFINNSSGQMWVESNPTTNHSAYPEFNQAAGVGKGGAYQFTFTKIGTWYYHNNLNSSRTGTVIVKE